MEGGEQHCLYEILESSSYFRLLFDQNSDNITNPSPLLDTYNFLSPQSGNNISSPHQNAGNITNPPPPSIHQNNVVNELADSDKRSEPKPKKNSKKKQKRRDNENEKQTWYKGPWTKTEDRKLDRLVSKYGRGHWSKVASQMPGRIGKQCRERWHNNLRPNIWKRTSWSDEEEMTIIEAHKIFGNRWSAIAKFLGGRSENDVKNHWHSIKRKQKTLRKIKRAKRLRHLYQSPILENYIKITTTTLATSSRSAATPPPTAAAPPPAFTLTTSTSPPIAASPPSPFTLTTAASNTRRLPITTTAGNINALAPIYSTTTPIAAATAFTPPPFTIFTENYNALSPTFSAAATFTPLPISTETENHETLIPNLFTTAAAVFSPTTPISENYSELSPTFSAGTTTAAATFIPPPMTSIIENDNAMFPIFSAAGTFTPPTPISENYNALSSAEAMSESNAVTATDVPLSVDDYDTDGIPYFALESAMNDEMINSEVVQVQVQVQPDNLTSESAIDENDLTSYYDDDDDLIGIRPYPIIADAYYYLAGETVDEEMDFMTSLFGNMIN